MDQRASVWLAGGLRAWPLCEPHQAVGREWTDPPLSYTAGHGEGQASECSLSFVDIGYIETSLNNSTYCQQCTQRHHMLISLQTGLTLHAVRH